MRSNALKSYDALRWIVGDVPSLWAVHDKQPWISVYGPLKVFESIMRGIGQVCFANNPWSGVLILIGLLIADPLVGFASVLASSAALVMSRILKQSDSVVVAGLQNYSAVLVGTVTVALFPVFFDSPMTLPVWLGLIFMGAFSVCLALGLGAVFKAHKLPVYTLPFNISTAILFLSLTGAGYPAPIKNDTATDEGNSTATEQIDWTEVMTGALKSSGQVYAVENVTSSVIILVGLFINSPMVTVASFLGALFSSLVALAISSPPYSSIYAGVWGYNGFLAAACLTFFVYPTPLSIALAFLNSVFAGFLQASLAPVFQANNLPVFTFPFCIASLVFLPLIENVPGLDRVSNLTFPEQHLWTKILEDRRNKTRRSQEIPDFTQV